MHQVEWFPFCACITQLSKTSLFFNNRVVLLLKNEKDIFSRSLQVYCISLSGIMVSMIKLCREVDLRKPNWHKLNHLKWNQWGCKHESICNQKLRLFSTSYSIEFLVHRIRIAEEDRKTSNEWRWVKWKCTLTFKLLS